VIADRTVYDVRYSYRLAGIVSVWVFNYLQFRTEVCFWCQFVAKRYILQ